ncbi:hypothetical protein LI90_587 [Carbonactinospora thermoautotrophica]|uniref:Uncharacterized protein n=1 Tax=Carbonactinospora thermoautotrophica TaxID=1469144 RepID=A0A132MM70_9ACTN|nr:hypothetical protein LI90_587 [Carbonactinospora thermoautotrophica]
MIRTPTAWPRGFARLARAAATTRPCGPARWAGMSGCLPVADTR